MSVKISGGGYSLKMALLAEESYLQSTFNVGECETLVRPNKTVIDIAVAGTEFFSLESLFAKKGIVDVWRDMRVSPWYDSRVGWGHAGFLKGAKKVYAELEPKLDKSKVIRLTGHSMGAAISSFLAIMLHSEGYMVNLVRFGCPGLHLSTYKYDFPCICYKNGGDYVYGMPTFMPYGHNNPVALLGIDNGRTLEDHAIGLYIDELERIS